MITWIQLLAFVLWAVALGLAAMGSWLAYRRAQHARWRTRQIVRTSVSRFKSISILKPLKGTDPGLEENLRSFFELDYPTLEIIFSIADANDAARAIVQDLQDQYPHVTSRLVVGALDVGANPKVNNLIKSFDLALHDWILISDSNVRVKPDYLRRLAIQFDENVGVLTAVVRGTSFDTIGGKLEATFLNTFYARWMNLAFFFGEPVVLGKSMLLQRSVAKRFGGFKTLAIYLAEDYMAGEAMQKLGYRIELLDDPVCQPLSGYSLSDFWNRHVRWGRIRKSQAPVLFFIEPLLSAVPSGVIGATLMAPAFSISGLLFFVVHMLVWFCLDQIIETSLSGAGSIVGSWLRLPIWLLREFLSIPLWSHIAAGNTVNWRGRILRVEYGGILTTQES